MKQLATITILVILFITGYLLSIKDTFAGPAFQLEHETPPPAVDVSLPPDEDNVEPPAAIAVKTPQEAASWARSQLARHERLLFSLYDFETGETFGYYERVSVFPASLIKTLYLVAYLEQAELGKQSLDTVHRLKEGDFYARGTPVKGMGFLQTQPPGIEYSHEELLILMTAQSDNIATNILVNALGMKLINDKAAQYGMKSTRVSRLMFEHKTEAANNRSTVADLTALLVALEKRKIVSGDFYDLAITGMKNAHKHRIGKYPPPGVTVANKIANTDALVGDMALIYFPDRKPIALTILIQSQGAHKINARKNDELIAEFSQHLMNYYLQPSEQ